VDYTTIFDKATGCYDSQFYDIGISLADGSVANYDENTRARTYKTLGSCNVSLPISLISFSAKATN